MKTEVRETLEENAECHYQDMRSSEIVPHLPDEHLKEIALVSIEGYLEDARSMLSENTENERYADSAIMSALKLVRALQSP